MKKIFVLKTLFLPFRIPYSFMFHFVIIGPNNIFPKDKCEKGLAVMSSQQWFWSQTCNVPGPFPRVEPVKHWLRQVGSQVLWMLFWVPFGSKINFLSLICIKMTEPLSIPSIPFKLVLVIWVKWCSLKLILKHHPLILKFLCSVFCDLSAYFMLPDWFSLSDFLYRQVWQ